MSNRLQEIEERLNKVEPFLEGASENPFVLDVRYLLEEVKRLRVLEVKWQPSRTIKNIPMEDDPNVVFRDPQEAPK